MAVYPSIYRAKAVRIDPSSIQAFVPQVFGDTPITISSFLGAKPGPSMGWVFFQSGDPDFPVWASGVSGGGGNGGNGGGGGGIDEVWVGPDTPAGAEEVWYDTDAVSPTSAITRAEADTRYINATGDMMQGPLTLVGNPVNPLDAAPKQYVDWTPWTAITFSSPWANYSTPTYQAGQWRYNPNGGIVELRGLIKPSTAISAISTITTMDVGYRPSAQNLLLGVSYPGPTGYHAPARIDITSAGLVQYIWLAGQTSPSWVSLNNVRWSVL